MKKPICPLCKQRAEETLENVKADLKAIKIRLARKEKQPDDAFSMLLVQCLCCVQHTEEEARYERSAELASLLDNTWKELREPCLESGQLHVITGLTTARDTLRRLFRNPRRTSKARDSFVGLR